MGFYEEKMIITMRIIMIHFLSPLYSQSHYSLLLIHRNQCAVTDPHRGAFMALQVTRYPVKGMLVKRISWPAGKVKMNFGTL